MTGFTPARPIYRRQAHGRPRRVLDRVLGSFGRLVDLLKLFYNEGVFFYFVLVVALMFVGSAIMIVVEAGRQGQSLLDLLIEGNYWAIVTIATCGYGDIVPETRLGRLLTIVLLFFSMGIVAMFTANLTSALTARKIKEARGLTTAKDHADHLLVLGWKKDMIRMLEEIIATGAATARDIVVVCDVRAGTAEEVVSHPNLAGIRLVRGPHFSDEFLKLANPGAAAGIMILADESAAPASDSEIDSKTVMAAMALAKYVRKGHVVAELLDPSFEPYLRNTKVVDEIVFPRRYGEGLLRLSAGSIGIVNTVNAIVDSPGMNRLVTYRIPAGLVGRTVDDLRVELVKDMPGALLVGLVENVGKYYERKAEAIREAQLTPDMEKLVSNLKRAKQMENNMPRLNPKGSYVLQANSMAVVIPAEEG
ncbi:MAG: potassium channel family protein [Deltaproteobacteria bacterium]|nr:potassium channel family protein [Deltaproteobacteria bacterium]